MAIGKKVYIGGGALTMGGLVIETNQSSPVNSRIRIGDGTGWYLHFSSYTTDVLSIRDNGRITMNNTDDATSSSNGALRCSGGAGIIKNVCIGGGSLYMDNTTANRIKLNSTSNNIWIGAVSADTSGDFHIFDNTSSR